MLEVFLVYTVCPSGIYSGTQYKPEDLTQFFSPSNERSFFPLVR